MAARGLTTRVLPPHDDYDLQFKVVVVGDSSVGKSCFLVRLTDDYFRENHVTTIGVDFKVKTLEIGTCRVKTNIWDTAGNERFRTLSNCFYRGAKCVIIAFSLTDRKSFDSVTRWIYDVDVKGGHGASKLLLATKADLENDKQVTSKEAQVLAERMGLMYAETSSKTGQCVEDSFTRLVSDQLDKQLGGMSLTMTDSDIIHLTAGRDVSAGWCTGCTGYT